MSDTPAEFETIARQTFERCGVTDEQTITTLTRLVAGAHDTHRTHTDARDAIAAFAMSLRGEVEPIRQFGVCLTWPSIRDHEPNTRAAVVIEAGRNAMPWIDLDTAP